MKTIDFTKLEIFTDLAKTRCVVSDVRKQISECIYNNGRGLAAHALALKIYNSNGAIEVNDDELAIIKDIINILGTPSLIDAIDNIPNLQIDANN